MDVTSWSVADYRVCTTCSSCLFRLSNGISHDDTILTIDWNSGISLEENDLRVYRLLAQVDSFILQTTSMVGVQQFLMSHTQEITPSESVIYIKAKDAESLKRIERKISDYVVSNYPKAQVSFHPR